MKNVTILDNPVLQDILANLRDKNTRSNEFRMNLKRAGYLMTYEMISKEIKPYEVQTETFLGIANGKRIKDKFLQIMILRAGQPFSEGASTLLDEMGYDRSIGQADAKRKEGKEFDFGNLATKPDEKLDLEMKIEIGSMKIPKFDQNTNVVIYDPMLATGSTMKVLLTKFKELGNAKNWILSTIVSAPYGIEKLNESFPDLKIYTLAVDTGGYKGLNEKAYIVPGLGDCGDRAFGSY